MAAIPITAANVKISAFALIKAGVAGGAISRGKPVYFDTAANGYKLAQANALAGALVAGVALNDAGLGQNFQFVVSDPQFNPGATTPLASGDSVWLGGVAAGDLTKTAADLVSTWANVFMGNGIGNGLMNLNIVQGGVIP